MKILLLNPPYSYPIIRDQYCSFEPKSDYYWPPIDLIVLSSHFQDGYEINFLDAILLNLTPEEVFQEINQFRPDALITLSSVISFQKDLSLLNDLKNTFSFKSILAGDLFYFYPDLLISNKAIDAIILQFPCPEITNYLNGETKLNNMWIKDSVGNINRGQKQLSRVIDLPIPHHELIPYSKYHPFPMVQTGRCASVVLSFGCLFKCKYCTGSSVPAYPRTFSSVENELKMLIQNGIREIWFRDFTLNANKEIADQMMAFLISSKVPFFWHCETRLETLSHETIYQMAASGCQTAMIGIDTIDQISSKSTSRHSSVKKSLEMIKELENKKISTLGYLIIGVPEDSIMKILKRFFIIYNSSLSYLSCNIFVPRPGSQYHGEKFYKEYLENQYQNYDSSFPNISYCDVKLRMLLALRLFITISFYLYPPRAFKLFYAQITRKTDFNILKSGLKMIFHFCFNFRSDPKKKNLPKTT